MKTWSFNRTAATLAAAAVPVPADFEPDAPSDDAEVGGRRIGADMCGSNRGAIYEERL